ncbi:class I SAM-dependent methyltransferase [Paenibacillus sp. 481]|uniref:class I SAM-dependent methyltransferase n=1 Tax=Paenibacillus sp. 481 TaxID=2835869 RepID=UPI001E41FBCA|nr:methyltransferase domain-containing protein [Paenibacillus sp. 481]UHA72552.1 methyltransferase domain-containing protein [Paenibacillus sp. 481]
MRIDLGCGIHKHPRCIGLDSHPYPGVDKVCDLNEGIPLPDDSVDFMIASNILQYLNNAEHIVQEMYRVCKHGTVVCLVVPYAHVTSHITHPEYRQLFDEHSPRHWTKNSYTPMNAEEYLQPLDAGWSLMNEKIEDSERTPLDFRLVRIEYFYFPEYRCLYDEVELRRLRQSQLNVVYQLMLHLVTVKGDMDELELESLTLQPMEEPRSITEQREKNDEQLVLDDRPFVIQSERRNQLENETSALNENVIDSTIGVDVAAELEVDEFNQQAERIAPKSKGKKSAKTRRSTSQSSLRKKVYVPYLRKKRKLKN